MPELPFQITTLLFIQDLQDRFLLIQRTRAPNRGCWSPPGGKLEMSQGESPFECAIREAREEIGMEIAIGDLHLWAMLSEKSFEGSGHWLMFCFHLRPRLSGLPAAIDEGHFRFFPRDEIDSLRIPPTDGTLLWPFFDRHHKGFIAYRADCDPARNLEIVVEQSI